MTEPDLSQVERTYSIARGGTSVSITVHGEAELIELRGELELMRQQSAGHSARALMALCNPKALEDDSRAEGIRDTLLNARLPAIEGTIKQIDTEFPRIAESLDTDAIAEQARAFHRDVANCLRTAGIEGAAELADDYASSIGLAGTDEEPVASTNDTDQIDDSISEAHEMTEEQNEQVVSEEAVQTPVESDAALPDEKDLASALDEIQTGLDSIEQLAAESEAMMESVDKPEPAETNDEPAKSTSEAAMSEETPDAGDIESSVPQPAADAEVESVEDAQTSDVELDSVGAVPEADIEHEPQPQSPPFEASMHDAETAAPPADSAPSHPSPEIRRPLPEAPRVRHRSSSRIQRRGPAGSVETAIEQLGAFLVDEVNELWLEAKQALEEMLTYRDEVRQMHGELSAVHQQSAKMRDEIRRLQQESSQIRTQIANTRDDAARAKQRADSAVERAENSADQAAAAARDAQSHASMAQATSTGF